MRFGEQLGLIAIPQWKQCYLNYAILKIFVMIIKEAVETLEQCEKLQSQNNQHEGRPLISRIDQLSSIRERLITILEEQNQLFYRIYSCQAEITELFYQMKVIQTQEKFEICQKLQSKHVEGPIRLLFLTYLEYAYIEVSYISEMREANLEAERKILKKHKKYSKKRVETPLPSHDKIGRMACLEEQYLNHLQDLYVEEQNTLASKQAREFLREAAQKSQTKSLDIFVFGLGVGATVVLLGILVGIIQYQGLEIDGVNKSVFSRDFPTWRGIAIFILYIWVLGFDVYFFEKYKISHRLILKFDDHHYSPSSYYFKIAGILTSIFMLTFLFYLLQISGVIKQKAFPEQYIVLIVWFSFALYLFMPLPVFNPQGRLYALKLIWRTLISPVAGTEFVLAWAADQAISLATPFRDFGYTVCYYTQLNFDDLQTNPCSKKSAFELVLLYVIISISYRVMQCIRVGYQDGKYLCTPHMGNTIKYMFSLLAAVLSFLMNSGQQSPLWLWILISIIATGYSFYWDLKYDWGLLESNSRNWLLRKYISFQPKKTYYIIMSANLIMRLAWIMTISPSFANLFGNPSLLTFVTGSIEIIRRGIWNLLRIQKEHLANCKEFRAIPDIKDIEAQLELLPDAHPLEGSQIPVGQVRDQIKKDYIVMIKRKIEERDAEEQEFNEQYQTLKIKQVKELKRIIREIKQANSKVK